MAGIRALAPAAGFVYAEAGLAHGRGERRPNEAAHGRFTQMKIILVIDDDENFSKTIEQALLMSGYEVVLAENGSQGIKLAQIHLPDLILSDVNMHNGDGYDVLAGVRGNRPTASIPFILMTAEPSSGGMLQGLSLSVDDYLPKPFTVPQLIEAIETAFKSREKRQP